MQINNTYNLMQSKAMLGKFLGYIFAIVRGNWLSTYLEW